MAIGKGLNIDLNQIRIQLRSSVPSEIKKGIDQVRKVLQENPDDADLYTVLVEAGRENIASQDEIRSLLQGMIEKGFVVASVALSALNKPIETSKPVEATIEQPLITQQVPVESDLMNLADDAYYADEYDKAIAIYDQILEKDPSNQRARQQKEKAELNRITASSNKNIPREALQKFRQARSFIAVRDFKSAKDFLTEAVSISQKAGVEFSEANRTINRLQELLEAADYRDQGNEAIRNGKWEEAQDLYHKAHRLDTIDQVVSKAEEIVKMLRKAEALFESYVMRVGNAQDQMARLQPVADAITAAENLNEIIGVRRFNILQAKYELYKACTELNNHRMIGLASQRRLVSALRTTYDILPPEDSTKKHAEGVLQKARKERFKLSILVIVIGLLALISYFTFGQENDDVHTPAPVTVIVTLIDIEETPSSTVTPSPTKTPTTFTLSATFTASPLPSQTMTPTTPFLETAYVTNIVLAHYFDKPNGRWLGELTRNQEVTVLDKKVVSGSFWYLCEWEKDGSPLQGWIFGDFLSFVSRTETPLKSPTPPFPSPTLTNTVALSLTPQGIGFINIDLMHPQSQPNGRWVAELRRNQIVTIYNSLIVHGDTWYFCKWDTNGEGWILSRYIVFGTPTPKP